MNSQIDSDEVSARDSASPSNEDICEQDVPPFVDQHYVPRNVKRRERRKDQKVAKLHKERNEE